MRTFSTLLDRFARSEISKEEVLRALTETGISEVGWALVDTDRDRRKGFPEVVLASRKKNEDIIGVLRCLIEKGSSALATRLSDAQAEALLNEFSPEGVWHADARVFFANPSSVPSQPYPTGVAVFTAGLSDVSVAEEAAVILEAVNYPVTRIYDVGVAGIHRLFSRLEHVARCEVAIVTAGMEGALPSIVAGLIEQPVIAVPSSIGYGVSEDGSTALRTMLASCSPGLAVVNIDNGYGAAMMAHSICLRIHRGKRREE